MDKPLMAGRQMGKRAALAASLRAWAQTQTYGPDARQAAYVVGPDGTCRWDATAQQWVKVAGPLLGDCR